MEETVKLIDPFYLLSTLKVVSPTQGMKNLSQNAKQNAILFNGNTDILLQDIFLYIDNQQHYGHLVDAENFDTTHLHNDLYQIFDNRYVSPSTYSPMNIWSYDCKTWHVDQLVILIYTIKTFFNIVLFNMFCSWKDMFLNLPNLICHHCHNKL